MKKLLSTILISCLFISLNAQTIVDIVVNSPDHNTLETAVIAAELADDLSGPGPFTLFAPTDAAFAQIDPDVLNTLLADPTGQLATILQHHAVFGVADSGNISDGLAIGNLIGQNLTFSTSTGNLTINGANITVTDLRAANGVVHVIDAVMLPEAVPTAVMGTIVDIVVNSPDHNTLETAVVAAGLADDLSGAGPFTLFAPTDAAFASIDPAVLDMLLSDPTGELANILLNHAVSGVADSGNISDGLAISSLLGQNLTFSTSTGSLTINGANITVTDIRAENGVVHVIDAVMLPEQLMRTIVDVVVDSPDHNTLETAVIAAGLADDLSGPGPFTLFAPTDAAFAALPAGVLDQLLADPTGALADVLLFHAVSGVASTANVTDGTAISSLLGKNLTFSINNNGVFINNINVSVLDIVTSNGVVHVIDAVLVP